MNKQQNAADSEGAVRRLVELLAERPGLSCTEIGETLWGGSKIAIARDRQHYARPAGKLVKLAMKLNLVREKYVEKYVLGKKHMRREFYLSNNSIEDEG